MEVVILNTHNEAKEIKTLFRWNAAKVWKKIILNSFVKYINRSNFLNFTTKFNEGFFISLIIASIFHLPETLLPIPRNLLVFMKLHPKFYVMWERKDLAMFRLTYNYTMCKLQKFCLHFHRPCNSLHSKLLFLAKHVNLFIIVLKTILSRIWRNVICES